MKRNRALNQDEEYPSGLTEIEEFSIASKSGDIGILGEGNITEIAEEESSNYVYKVEFNEQNMRWSGSSMETPIKQNKEKLEYGMNQETLPEINKSRLPTDYESLEGRISRLEEESSPVSGFIRELIQHSQIIPYTISILLMMTAFHTSSLLSAVCGGLLLIATGAHYGD